MSSCCENMSATSGNYSESSERNYEGTLCRLCMKMNDYYYNIFTSVVASEIPVEDALYDLIDLRVSAGLHFSCFLVLILFRSMNPFSARSLKSVAYVFIVFLGCCGRWPAHQFMSTMFEKADRIQ